MDNQMATNWVILNILLVCKNQIESIHFEQNDLIVTPNNNFIHSHSIILF
jgi:hypothetical protein